MSQPKTIQELVLEQYERQERFTYRDEVLLVMSVQQELGQLTTALLPLFKFRTLPEKWDGAWGNWERTQQQVISSVIAQAARFVEMGEYISYRSGWTYQANDVLRVSLSGYKYSAGDWQQPYLRILTYAAMMADPLLEWPTAQRHVAGRISSHILKMIFYCVELIYRIQTKS